MKRFLTLLTILLVIGSCDKGTNPFTASKINYKLDDQHVTIYPQGVNRPAEITGTFQNMTKMPSISVEVPNGLAADSSIDGDKFTITVKTVGEAANKFKTASAIYNSLSETTERVKKVMESWENYLRLRQLL